MIGYETYKMLHLFALLTVFTSLGFVASSSTFIQQKRAKILLGFFSFMIFVAGMGLVARIGFKHGEGFPFWLIAKMGNWFLLNVFFIFLFRCKNPLHKGLFSLLMLLTAWASVWLAIHKPV
ncbi:MAG: hypothetical protein KBD76_10565 [Bacteriovorax sp.]|nr:hypothetical protein [Bacteriovorax sp.]